MEPKQMSLREENTEVFFIFLLWSIQGENMIINVKKAY